MKATVKYLHIILQENAYVTCLKRTHKALFCALRIFIYESLSWHIKLYSKRTFFRCQIPQTANFKSIFDSTTQIAHIKLINSAAAREAVKAVEKVTTTWRTFTPCGSLYSKNHLLECFYPLLNIDMSSETQSTQPVTHECVYSYWIISLIC